ncbi:MAG: type II secretion system minor pseudopilin GspJ [Kangiellaceae bacterium]|nr:type II secretion system minor pseudopilin GspJ [Kangiellaceae bacterium]
MTSEKKGLKRTAGFTLTEILIALFIFSVVVFGALQVFNFIQTTSEGNDKTIDRLRALQMTVRQIEDDIRYMVPRDRRNEFGDKAPLLKSETTSANSYLEFTRAGWRNPAKLQRSNLQHLKYELIDDELVRHHWLFVDSAMDKQELTRSLLTGVEQIKFEFLIENDWKDEWTPEREDLRAMPEAIKVTMQLKDYGEIYRLFSLTKFSAEQKASADVEPPSDVNGRN